MNIGVVILMIIGGGAGLLSTFYLTFSIPVVLVYKCYRKAKFGTSLFK